MRLLFVEDDEAFIESLVPRLERLDGASVETARSRDSAFRLIGECSFDAIILDLKLPTADNSLDENVDHGRAVLAHARSIVPGTPIIILTGSSTEEFVSELLRQTDKGDPWGCGEETFLMVDLVRKTDVQEGLFSRLSGIAEHLRALRAIECDDRDCGLSEEEKRVLRICARRFSARSCTVEKLAGGHSGSRVVRVTMRDTNGAIELVAAARLDTRESVRGEIRTYERHVVRLQPRAIAQRVETVLHAPRSNAGVFYRLDQGGQSLFSILRSDPSHAAGAVNRLCGLMSPWIEGAPFCDTPVSDIRRVLLDDQTASEIIRKFGLGWAVELEDRLIQSRWGTAHGDLQGENVLVDPNGNPIIIDYSDVADGVGSIDPVTLELSPLFHPNGIPATGDWPVADVDWTNPEEFAAACHYRPYVIACREWSRRVAAGPREVCASAYSYLLRQLKYDDTNKEVALMLLESVRRAFDRTY